MPATSAPDRTGLLLGAGAYGLWGFLPLYFPLLSPAGPVEIIAHRVLWSLVFCVGILLLTRTWRASVAAVRDRRMLATLALAGVLVATNWLVFVFGVLSGHTVDAALGYYINPLVTVGLAVLVLGERLRRAQWVALGIGAAGVVVLTVGVGRLPWIALTLAVTFGMYGLIKNRVGRTVPALASLAVETAVLGPVALIYLAVLGSAGAFGAHGPWHALALAGYLPGQPRAAERSQRPAPRPDAANPIMVGRGGMGHREHRVKPEWHRGRDRQSRRLNRSAMPATALMGTRSFDLYRSVNAVPPSVLSVSHSECECGTAPPRTAHADGR